MSSTPVFLQTRLATLATGLCAALALLPGSGMGQAFPSKTISIVVPSAPGGSLDPLARAMQPGMSRRLGQTVIVENKPGAAGQLATQYVARATPDGHTLLLSFDSHVMSAVGAKHRGRPLPYDVFKDFTPISLVARIPFVFAVSSKTPVSSVPEFIAYAKRNQGKLSYGTSGVGAMQHFATERFKQAAGIDIVHIPYQGAAGIPRLMADDIQLHLSSFLLMRAGYQAGTIKVLGILDSKRLNEIPNVPTMAEVGFPGFEAYTWYGLFGPAQMPQAVVDRLQAEAVAAINETETRDRLVTAGFTLIGSPPAQLASFMRSEFDRWDKFATDNKLNLNE